MSITKINNIFHLSNTDMSYLIKIMPNGQLEQLYFGPTLALKEDDFSLLEHSKGKAAGTVKYAKNSSFTLADKHQECALYGTTAFQEASLEVTIHDIPHYLDLKYLDYDTQEEKLSYSGPHVRLNDDAEILSIRLEDAGLQLQVTLEYVFFKKGKNISKRILVKNKGQYDIVLTRALSSTFWLEDANDYQFYHFPGAWISERQLKKYPLQQGVFKVESLTGTSSHQHNPFIAIVENEATFYTGMCYGANLVYSGNFIQQIDVNEWNQARLMSGISPYTFSWQLKPNENFATPQTVLSFSQDGLNGLAQENADFISEHIISPFWVKRERPIVLNSWETYVFDFDENKLLTLAKEAAALGIECFVVDDGWFAKRNNDRSSLGDWYPNPEKFPNGLQAFAKKIHQIGLQFGLWFEPEMVNEDTEFYRKHPDWIVEPPQGRYSYGRGQLVLDFTNPAVVENIFEQMSRIIDETQLDYLKWDMNRNLTEVYSNYLAKNGIRQGEFFHRYVQGVYQLYEKLLERYPNLLIEGCASGGGRFDLGILYYSPQIWVSDNTDAIARLDIQENTALAYPITCLSNHVSQVPNGQIQRITPLETRFNVAIFGILGYELDLLSLDEHSKNIIKQQIALYKNLRHDIMTGRFYQVLKRPNQRIWALQSPQIILVGYFSILADINQSTSKTFTLPFVDSQTTYDIVDNQTISGSLLKYRGIPVPIALNGTNQETAALVGDFQSKLLLLRKH